jgi:ABC-type transport system substrate-binding protein
MLGALEQDHWKAMLTQTILPSKKPLNIDLFVMKALKPSALYIAAKSALDALPVRVNEVVYDPNQPSSPEWKRRSNGDYDLLFGYEESYSTDPDPFWRDMRNLSASPKSFFSNADLDEALMEPDVRKRALLYQKFERLSAEDPFVIPLQRFGNELFVTPNVEVAPQEAFGMMINLWAFK